MFSALEYLREEREEPPRPPTPPAEDRPPHIIAKAEEATSQEIGYEEELINTDQFEILAEPSAPEFPSSFSSPSDQDGDSADELLDAALEGLESVDTQLEQQGAVEFDNADEEALLDAQLELGGRDAGEHPDTMTTSGGPFEDEPSEEQFELEAASELLDATFGSLEEGEFSDSQLVDVVAAELAIEQALQAAMAEEEVPDDQPEIDADAGHAITEDSIWDASPHAAAEDIAEQPSQHDEAAAQAFVADVAEEPSHAAAGETCAEDIAEEPSPAAPAEAFAEDIPQEAGQVAAEQAFSEEFPETASYEVAEPAEIDPAKVEAHQEVGKAQEEQAEYDAEEPALEPAAEAISDDEWELG
ncbi:MAG: hypothetical protein ACYTFZ_10575, partial [Planctomycetota bacterium]